MLDKYIEAVTSGTVNGYGYIDSLTDGQITILTGIVGAITKGKYSNDRDGLKEFTLECSQDGKDSNRKLFDRYARNVVLAADDLAVA